MDEHLKQSGGLNRICGNGEGVVPTKPGSVLRHVSIGEVKELTLNVAMGSKETEVKPGNG